jgi:hypothetical protein
MNEVWKELIKDFYEISNMGRVRSLDRMVFERGREIYCSRKGLVLKQDACSGYNRVWLKREGVAFRVTVHIEVAKHFVENPLNAPIVNHIDGDKSNNRSDNLEWLTYSENSKHSYKMGLQVPISKLCADDVRMIRDGFVNGLTNSELAAAFNVHRGTISEIRLGRAWVDSY